MSDRPVVRIRYCTGCKWLLRAAWLAQELLSTFGEEPGEVTLIPDETGGVFDVHIDSELVWSRAAKKRFPEVREIKQAVRDIVAPGRDLGHIDA
ncbi:MAG: SelT/SelW/SelH family protein [Gammaproteobacteria bacterium]|jgi:selenoprotein W-related protein|nr:SelT/SelW/SelH family protein [Gammaproteobacteria bacterium]MDP6617034.1 SelT/SelW/SelH family protein [Gammaproteobacteria bacterium]MDP6695074.1 SelT/SelW/SelH family protein [Gammaproteobacteria bacterium]